MEKFCGRIESSFAIKRDTQETYGGSCTNISCDYHLTLCKHQILPGSLSLIIEDDHHSSNTNDEFKEIACIST